MRFPTSALSGALALSLALQTAARVLPAGLSESSNSLVRRDCAGHVCLEQRAPIEFPGVPVPKAAPPVVAAPKPVVPVPNPHPGGAADGGAVPKDPAVNAPKNPAPKDPVPATAPKDPAPVNNEPGLCKRGGPACNNPAQDEGKQKYIERGAGVLNEAKASPADRDAVDFKAVQQKYADNYASTPQIWSVDSATSTSKLADRLKEAGITVSKDSKLYKYDAVAKNPAGRAPAYQNVYSFREAIGQQKNQFLMIAMDQDKTKDPSAAMYWNEGRAVEMQQAMSKPTRGGMPLPGTTKNGGMVNRYHIINQGTLNRINDAVTAKTGTKPENFKAGDKAVTLTPADGDLWTALVGTVNVAPSVRMFSQFKSTFGDLELTKMDAWPAVGKDDQWAGLNLYFTPKAAPKV